MHHDDFIRGFTGAPAATLTGRGDDVMSDVNTFDPVSLVGSMRAQRAWGRRATALAPLCQVATVPQFDEWLRVAGFSARHYSDRGGRPLRFDGGRRRCRGPVRHRAVGSRWPTYRLGAPDDRRSGLRGPRQNATSCERLTTGRCSSNSTAEPPPCRMPRGSTAWSWLRSTRSHDPRLRLRADDRAPRRSDKPALVAHPDFGYGRAVAITEDTGGRRHGTGGVPGHARHGRRQ